MKAILSLTVLTMALFACKKEGIENTDTPNKRTVQYSISCTDCFVYCTGANGSTHNFYHQNSSWTYTYEASAHDTLLLVAQNTSGAPAAVAGAIRLNGIILTADTSYCPINGTIFISDTL